MLTEQSRNSGISLSPEALEKFRETVKNANAIRDGKLVAEIDQLDSVGIEATEKK